MPQQAAVIKKAGKMSPNGREGVLELRHGAKGTGTLIQRVTYWPWSDKSVDAAYRTIDAAAEQADVTVIYPSPEE